MPDPSATQPLKPLPNTNTYDADTRRQLMWLLVGGFLCYSALLAVLMAIYGWSLSPTANAIVVMTLQAIITSMTAATGYYFGAALQNKGSNP